jgi:hypothetical protein
VEAIEFPDVEAVLVGYLNVAFSSDASFSTVRAYVNVPATRPDEFVRLYRIGGSAPELVVERVTVLVDCYALKSARASALARRTMAYLRAIESAGGAQFYNPQVFAGPANLPDPNVSTQSRYTATVSVGVRGTAI